MYLDSWQWRLFVEIDVLWLKCKRAILDRLTRFKIGRQIFGDHCSPDEFVRRMIKDAYRSIRKRDAA